MPHPDVSADPNVPAPPLARLRRWVVSESSGGLLLLGAAVLALIWANSPLRESYTALTGAVIGPETLHLDLSVQAWASDGLLTIFFFVVGLELKHEFVAGSLRDLRSAGVPILAAAGGVVVPAVLYTTVVMLAGQPEALGGWAIPAATDIAFALAVLAVFGRGLPRGIRTFLLTLAVVDDLIAIAVIAVFYTDSVSLTSLLTALAMVAVFAVLVRARTIRAWLLVPIALLAWYFMHEAGVHATIAGVLLGVVVPAVVRSGEAEARTSRIEHQIRPFSAGIALPVFAFAAAGVTFVGEQAGSVFARPVVPAIVVGLVLGKFIGVVGTAYLVTRFTGLRLPQGITIRDLVPVGLLAGIGFTVALLIAALAFEDEGRVAAAKVAVLLASVLAAALGGLSLRILARRREPAGVGEP